MRQNYSLYPRVDLHWSAYAPAVEARAEEVRSGKTVIPVEVPVNPVPWIMTIP